MKRWKALLVTASAAVALAVTGTPASAAQSDMTPLWFGTPHEQLNTSTSYGGWVDGNGPDSYRAYVLCTGGAHYGVSRWAGDSRGSFAYCPSGTAFEKGFELIYA